MLAGQSGLSWPLFPPAVPARPAGSRSRCAAEAPASSAPLQDEAALIARVRKGDEDAARIMVEQLYPTVIKSIRCHLPRRTSEEDLTQAVFAKVFTKLGQFSGLVPLEHWVSRIAVNTCLNRLKHEEVRREVRMSDLSEDQEAMVQHLAASDDDLPVDHTNAAAELLEKLLAPLRADERLVISLLHLEERSVVEVSRLTGWTVSLVKVKAFRTRRKMRKLWQTLLQGQKP
jgi:RNA polymerase sigma-70 factor (ECF subfamily)